MNLRVIVFSVLFISLLMAEIFYPYRNRVLLRMQRWPGNLLLIFIDSLLLKLILPAGLFVVSIWASEQKIGFLNYFELQGSFTYILSFIFLDMMIYFQHVFSHKWNILWRFHGVHHSDLDLDVTSGLRFHPVEILYSLMFKICLILFIGIDKNVILVFEIVLNGMSMFSHSNVKLPASFEKYLRYIFVTPQMHIIHHSVQENESNTNFSFNFSIWDNLFKTYSEKFKSDGVIGYLKFNKSEDQTISQLLSQPFRES